MLINILDDFYNFVLIYWFLELFGEFFIYMNFWVLFLALMSRQIWIEVWEYIFLKDYLG